MAGKRIPAVSVRAREVEVARLTARKVPQSMIVSALGISERQVRYDLQHFRQRISQAAGANKMLTEVYEELFRTGWKDHDDAPQDDARGVRARAAVLRVLVEIADRLAALSGIDLKNLVPASGGDTYVLGDATFDQRRLEVSPELRAKLDAAGGDGDSPGGS